jgi:hypothetical protein
MNELIKTLSSNDVGSTGGHQSGVVIPIKIATQGFFPELDSTIVNPRAQLDAVVDSTGKNIRLNYIYYNGKMHETSTRNEYRLTGISSFLKDSGAQEGDSLIITKVGELRYRLRVIPANEHVSHEEIVVTLSKDWFYRRQS